jgi:lysine/ornithine N-monooxygenase
MKTIRYYTDTNKYIGWKKYDFQKHYLEYRNWIKSGNRLEIKHENERMCKVINIHTLEELYQLSYKI